MSETWAEARTRADEAKRAAAIVTHHALGLEADDAGKAVVEAMLNVGRKLRITGAELAQEWQRLVHRVADVAPRRVIHVDRLARSVHAA